jgi:ParB family chromosome partitioning protein
MIESQTKIFDVPMVDIYPDESFNCRGKIVPADVIDLARSIDKIGLQQAIVIQPFDDVPGKKYRIVSGHRRFMAYRLNKAVTIPATIKEGLDEMQARLFNLEENIKRKDLNILQEALAIQHFVRAGWTQEDVSRETNQSRGWVQARFSLLRLPEEIQQEAAAGFLTQEQIKQLSTLKSKDMQYEAVKKIKDAKLRGDKGKIRAAPKKAVNPLTKKVRDKEEIFPSTGTHSNHCW